MPSMGTPRLKLMICTFNIVGTILEYNNNNAINDNNDTVIIMTTTKMIMMMKMVLMGVITGSAIALH